MEILRVPVGADADIIFASQVARNVASSLGFEYIDRAAIAAATTELAYTVVKHARKGEVSFNFHTEGDKQGLEVRVENSGSETESAEMLLAVNGESNLSSVRSLIDEFDLETDKGAGTKIAISKWLPGEGRRLSEEEVRQLALRLSEQEDALSLEEIHDYNQELIHLLSELKAKDRQVGKLIFELKEASKEILALKEELERLTVTDPLTGLYNRRHFENVITTEIARSERQQSQFSLLFFDIDDFNHVNVSYGHQAGDEVLVDIGKVIINSTRKLVDTAFRFGGDEFAVIFLGADLKQGVMIAERIKTAFSKVDEYGVTFSMGLTAYCPGDTKDALITRADAAMYRAKMEGGNRIAEI